MTSSTSYKPYPLHFVIVPFMAQGHMIPLTDIARLLAQRGVTTTIITTPYNIAKIKNVITRDVISGSIINIVEVKFPSDKAGLKEGLESIDLLDSMAEMVKFFKGAELLEEQVEKVMKDMNPRPNCLIGDVSLPFTSNIAKKLKIPKLVFHGFSSFALLCVHLIRQSGILSTIESDEDYFQVPNIPGMMEFSKAQALVLQRVEGDMKELTDKLIEADDSAYGVIVNTFEELEMDYVKEYKKARGGKVWCIGPVSLCNKLGLDKVERGDKTLVDQDQWLKWLDSQEHGSVLYVCLGSISNLPLGQLKELGLGLEESKKPFIWVIRKWERYNELEKWILGFEERTKDRGLVIRGWVPQVLILSHISIGGFLTHCGWNSTLEGISAGVPLITWPLFADQFFNEKLIVKVLKVGLKIGVEKPMKWGKEEEIGVLVNKESVRKRVDELLGDNEEAQGIRRRAKELGEIANKALEEGGSSHSNITSFIEDIMKQQIA